MQPSSVESPFKRDEPVSRSLKWMWLLMAALGVWLVFRIWDTARALDVSWDTLLRLLAVAVHVCVMVSLYNVIQAAKRNRKHRNFEVMAGAIKAQRPFWTFVAIAAGAGSLTLAVRSIEVADTHRAVAARVARMAKEVARVAAPPAPPPPSPAPTPSPEETPPPPAAGAELNIPPLQP